MTVGTGVAVGCGVAVGSGVAVGAGVAVGSGVAVGAAVAVGAVVAVGVGTATIPADCSMAVRPTRKQHATTTKTIPPASQASGDRPRKRAIIREYFLFSGLGKLFDMRSISNGMNALLANKY